MSLSMITIASPFLVLALIFLGRSVYRYYHPAPTNHEATLSTTLTPLEKPLVGPDAPIATIINDASPLPRSITDPDEDIIERCDWVQRLTDHVHQHRHASRYNVLTIHTNIDYNFRPEGVVERFSLTYANRKTGHVIPYETVVFRSGHLTRLGDGGYVNWCFEGNFERMDNFVVFKDVA